MTLTMNWKMSAHICHGVRLTKGAKVELMLVMDCAGDSMGSFPMAQQAP